MKQMKQIKRIKRVIFAFFVLFSVLSGCNKESGGDNFLEIDAGSLMLNFGVEAGYQAVTVSANVDFRVISNQTEWCKTVVSNYQVDNLRISVTKNKTFEERHATVTISADGMDDVNITVNQTGVMPVFSVVQKNILIGENSEFSLDVNANFPIVFDLPAWISEKEGNSWVSGNKKYYFKASSFSDPSPSREATITVRAESPSGNLQPFSVSIVQLSDDLQGCVTLKCDFHMHTVFSDGLVWPAVRIDEAYRDGLDAVAITEHIDWRPNLPAGYSSHNSSYELAEAPAREKGIILIRGSEISIAMPVGHHNALFLSNSDPLDKIDYMDSFRAAKSQNAFMFFNHPQWTGYGSQINTWTSVLAQLYEQDMLHGIEVVNNFGGYSPVAHRWCLDKKLTMIGNTDYHEPAPSFAAGRHRTMTLVFAREATSAAIHEALKERRTAVHYEDYVIGEEKYLKHLSENALEWNMMKNGNNVEVSVTNNSDMTFRMRRIAHDPRLVVSVTSFTIAPKGAYAFTINLTEGITGGDLNFSVDNFLAEPNVGMKYVLKIQ